MLGRLRIHAQLRDINQEEGTVGGLPSCWVGRVGGRVGRRWVVVVGGKCVCGGGGEGVGEGGGKGG